MKRIPNESRLWFDPFSFSPEEVEQMSANEHGLLCGAHVGGYVIKNFLLPRPGKPHRGH